MGFFGAQIGNYSMNLHDSIYDDVKKSKPKEYYEKYRVDIEFNKDLNNGYVDRESLCFPLTMFGKIKKLKKYYTFDFDINLGPILFDELKKRMIVLDGICELSVYIGEDDKGKRRWKTYYLTSEIGKTTIELSDYEGSIYQPCKEYDYILYPVIHKIKSYDDLLWLNKNGLEFVQKS